MKKIFTYCALLIVAVVFSSCSATKRMASKEPLRIVPENLDLAVNTNSDPYFVPIEYTVVVPKHYVARNSQLRLVPYLTDGNRQFYLTPIYINGKGFSKIERCCARFNNPVTSYGEGVNVESGRNPETVTIRDNVPFQLWMSNAQMEMATLVNVCKKETLISTRIMADGIFYMPVSLGPEIPPAPRIVVMKGKKELVLALDYKINSFVIDPALGDNASQMAGLRAFMDASMKDSTINITLIDLIGVASPDGPLALNLKLAQQRAQSVKELVDSEFPAAAALTKVDFVGADWAGLYALIEGSSLADKMLLIDQLKAAPDDVKRNTIMYNFKDFRYIADNLLPKLRRTVCDIYYTTREVKVVY